MTTEAAMAVRLRDAAEMGVEEFELVMAEVRLSDRPTGVLALFVGLLLAEFHLDRDLDGCGRFRPP